MQVESFISSFSAPFGQIWKISVPIMNRISQIFRNTPYFLSLCHFEGSYSQSKINFRATSFATRDCNFDLQEKARGRRTVDAEFKCRAGVSTRVDRSFANIHQESDW